MSTTHYYTDGNHVWRFRKLRDEVQDTPEQFGQEAAWMVTGYCPRFGIMELSEAECASPVEYLRAYRNIQPATSVDFARAADAVLWGIRREDARCTPPDVAELDAIEEGLTHD